VTVRPLLAVTAANEADESALTTKPTAEEDEQVGTSETAAAEQVSDAVAEKLTVLAALHSTEAVGPVHVTVGATGVMARVSLQVFLLPALSVAVQTTTMPLLL
jgi:hypothetical protein